MKFVKKVLLAVAVLLSAFAEGKLKPYDYEVEYLESTGTQYIDTGCTPSINDQVEWIGECNEKNVPFGCLNFAIAFADNMWWKRCNLPSGMRTNIRFNLKEIFVGKTVNIVSKGGKYKGSRGNHEASGHLWLFGRSDTGIKGEGRCSLFIIAGRIYLIPVVKSNEGMMYDRVSGQLFRNAGTGAFVVGPRKADSAVEIAMGEMEVRE